MTTNQQMTELEPYLEGMRSATTPDELEAAFQKDHTYRKHGFQSRGMRAIEKVRIEEGIRLCSQHPHGHLVPKYGPRRRLEISGETYRVGKGENSTGVRYVWAYAEDWAIDAMMRGGLSRKAAHMVWDSFRTYPHRALRTVERAMAGELPDPQLNVLIRHERPGSGPVRYSAEENRREDGGTWRASRPCPCGGTLFDWGAGHSCGFEFVNWHCIVCPDVFTEYMTKKDLYALRSDAHERKAA